MDGVAFERARQVFDGDADFVLGLFVFFELKAAGHGLDAGGARDHRVIAEGRVGAEREIAPERTHGGERDGLLFVNGVAVGVVDGDIELAGGGRVSEPLLAAEDAFEIDGVAGTVDGPVGVNGAVPRAGSTLAEVEAVRRFDGPVVVVTGEHNHVLDAAENQRGGGDAGRVGRDAGGGLVAGYGRDGGVGHGRARLAIGHVGDEAAGGLFGDHGDVADDDDRIGAQIAIGGFEEEDAFAGIVEGDRFVRPAAALRHVLFPDLDHSLRIEQGQRGEMGDAARGLGFAAAVEEMADGVVGLSIQLLAGEGAVLIAPLVFPVVEAFEQGQGLGRLRLTAAELVEVFEIGEEADRVLDAVEAEFERLHAPGTDLHGGFVARGPHAGTGDREEGLLVLLRGERESGEDGQCEEERFHGGQSRRRLSRQQPRKLALPGTGRHSGDGWARRSATATLRTSPEGPV